MNRRYDWRLGKVRSVDTGGQVIYDTALSNFRLSDALESAYDPFLKVRLGALLNSFEAESIALFERMTVQPPEAIKELYNTAIKYLKTNNVFNKVDALYFFNVYNSEHSLLNIIKNQNNCTLAYGSGGAVPSFTQFVGITGSIANKSYIDTNYNPTLHGVNYQRNAASIGCYKHSLGSALACCFGNKTNINTYMQHQNATARASINNNSLDFTFYSPSGGIGLHSIIRYSDTISNRFFNKTKGSDISQASAALSNTTITLLSANGTYFDDSTISMAFIAGALTESELGIIYDAFIDFKAGIDAYYYNSLNYVTSFGDSTIALFNTPNAVDVLSLMDADTYLIDKRAVSGDTLAGVDTKIDALIASGKKPKVTFIQIGQNDTALGGAAMVSALQSIVTKLRSYLGPSNKIVINTLTPGSRYGTAWLYYNNAITSGLITGHDAVIQSHTDTLNDGSGALKAEYAYDTVHPNNAGRQIMADLWDAQIDAFGI